MYIQAVRLSKNGLLLKQTKYMKKLRYCLLFILLNIIAGEGFTQNRPVIDHTALYIVDLKKTVDFYQNIIGLDTIPEPFRDGRHAWFDIGHGASLHVIQGAPQVKEYYKNNHLCFRVPDMELFIAKLIREKIEFENLGGQKNIITVRVDGVKQLWLRDPDGYWIEINNAK